MHPHMIPSRANFKSAINLTYMFLDFEEIIKPHTGRTFKHRTNHKQQTSTDDSEESLHGGIREKVIIWEVTMARLKTPSTGPSEQASAISCSVPFNVPTSFEDTNT